MARVTDRITVVRANEATWDDPVAVLGTH